MRNILAYPLTHDEIIQTLEQMRDEFVQSDDIGGMRGYILQEVIKKLNAIHATEMHRID
jgi:hypothetical protein